MSKPDWQIRLDVEDKLHKIITLTWRSYKYWERNKYGSLTLKGWKKSLEDGKRLLAGLDEQANEIREFLPSVERVIYQLEEEK